jgi:hypothetical protein
LFFGDAIEGNLELKDDFNDRPCYVTANRLVVLEAFSPLSKQAQDFLIAIAEPVTRPNRIHEYKITEFSLYAAISVGLETLGILSVLRQLSKTELPQNVEDFIREKTMAFGKVKLVLKNGEYWIESMFETVISTLLKDSIIRDSRADTMHSSLEKEWITIQVDPIQPLSLGRRVVSEQEIKDTLDGIDLFQDWSNEDILENSPLRKDSSLDLLLDSSSDLEISRVENLIPDSNQGKDDVFGDVITIDQQDDDEGDLLDLKISSDSKKLVVNTFQIKFNGIAQYY